jgi:hypothetical protein
MHHYPWPNDIYLCDVGAGHPFGLDRRILMKTMILAAAAAMTLGVGAAYAQGAPAGYHEPAYGSQAFSDHRNEASNQFLGKDTVLGKMFRSPSNGDVATGATPAKGG